MKEQVSSVIGGMPWGWDLETGNLTHFGIPAIALWLQPSLEHLLTPLREEIGPDLFRLMVAHSSSVGAEEDYQTIVSKENESFATGFERWSNAVSSAGWGRFKLLEFDPDQHRALVRVNNPWELHVSGLGTDWGCPFLQGKIIGLFNRAFGVNCWADDFVVADVELGYVEFRVAPSDKTIELELAELREARMRNSEQALSREVARKTAELRTAQQQQRAILASLSELVLTVTPEGVVEQYRLPTDHVSRFPPQHAAEGQLVSDVFGGAFDNAVTLAQECFPAPYAITFSIGEGFAQRHYDARASLRRNTDQSLAGLTIAVRDVTEQQRLTEELTRRKQMESVGQLAGGIAHDFNNILAAVTGAAELLRLQVPSEQQTLVDTILEASSSAAGAIQGMLSFSKLQQAPVVLDLHDVMAKTVALLERTLDRRITCHLDLQARAPMIEGVANRLQGALLNLGVNARDALPAGGDIYFRTRDLVVDSALPLSYPPTAGDTPLPAGRYLELVVEDNGEGMSAETTPHIFEPFYSTKADGAGTGLGLTGVERTVLSHGGRFTVRSSLGRGSAFSLYFPTTLELQDEVVPAAIDVRALEAQGEHTILLVDDDPQLRRIGAQLLERLGYRVRVAVDGADALRQQQGEDAIDLVILDLNMPVLNGVDALVRLKARNPQLPVLIATGFSSGLAVPSGHDGVLHKPYRIKDLAAAVAALLPSAGS